MPAGPFANLPSLEIPFRVNVGAGLRPRPVPAVGEFGAWAELSRLTVRSPPGCSEFIFGRGVGLGPGLRAFVRSPIFKFYFILFHVILFHFQGAASSS